MTRWPSPLEAVVLHHIIQEGPIHGQAIVRKGVKHGSVYEILRRLEKKGLVQGTTEEQATDGYIGLARKYYWATNLGTRFAQALEALNRS
jgi:DNA-binding PadR family transcriptional regulator